MLAYFWGKWSLGKYYAFFFPFFFFFLGAQCSSHWRQWKFCYCPQWDNDLWMLQVFKCKLKYRAFSGKTKQKKHRQANKKIPTKTENNKITRKKKKKEKIQKFIAVAKEEKRELKCRFFWWRIFFFPCCLYIPCSTLKIGTQDVIPWKQLDTTGFVNYFCQGLDSEDLIFIFFFKFNWFFLLLKSMIRWAC